jgi:hypothetical protein
VRAVDLLDAVAEQPAAVLAAAREGPPAAHAVPAWDRHRGAGRVESAADDGIRAVGVQRVERRTRKAGEVEPAARADHHGPAHRRVGLTQRFEHPHCGGEVSAGATVSSR